MWEYEKRLQFPVKIKNPDARAAKIIISQYGGPDGELGASLRYLSQRFAMPYPRVSGLLTDIGTEELAHLEMIGAIVHQLTTGVYPQSAGGAPFSAMTLASKGDPITDLTEDMAAEQKARTTYDNILSLVDDPDIIAPIRFLREREVVHFQRFGEALGMVRDHLDSKNYYSFNPAFPNGCRCRNGNLTRP